jgi:sugar lactone lactonase YvrE
MPSTCTNHRPTVRANHLTAALLLVIALPLHAQAPQKRHDEYRDEAAAAYVRKDYATAKEATLAALSLRPDSPRYLHNLAALSARLNDTAAALDFLRQLSDLGVAPAIERDPDFASLQGTPEFSRMLQEFAAKRAPRGEAEILAALTGRTGIIEGIAFRERTGDLFLGDVHHRCIWRRDRDGRVARFSAEDEEMLGVFGIAIDDRRNTLWATMSAVPEMSGYTPEMKGYAALAEFNLGTSELRRVVPVTVDGREHGLGDLCIGPDGSVYATDSKAPVIWLLAPESEELQKVIDSPVFGSLQGIVMEGRTLVVADHLNGLFTVEIATGNINALPPPKSTTLAGLDGIVTVPGGIVATQNGVEPQRVIRVSITPELDAVTNVTVLAAGLPELTDLSLVTLMHDRPIVVAGAGWDGMTPMTGKSPPEHTVRVFQIALP